MLSMPVTQIRYMKVNLKSTCLSYASKYLNKKFSNRVHKFVIYMWYTEYKCHCITTYNYYLLTMFWMYDCYIHKCMYTCTHLEATKPPVLSIVGDLWPLKHVSLYTFKTLDLNSESFSCPVVLTHWEITPDFEPS